MPTAKLRFRDYELDPDGFELCRAGHRVRLERKPMALLILLAENQGHLVKREEIIEKIWGKDFFFDAENGINNAIRKIRSALHDNAEHPLYVETSLGKGYRFVAPVERVLETVGSPAPEQGVLRRPPTSFRWRHAWVPALGVTAFIATVFAFNLTGIRSRVFARRVPPIHSIAVLPLQNLSGDPNQEYFADGMTDALITNLAQFGSLRVISRTSAMHYKGSHKSLPEIARELNVDAVVEGSVTRSGNQVRITAQLLDTHSDRHLWAKAYDRDTREIMSLQQDVADSIAHEIQAKLTPQENLRQAQNRQVDPEAYDDYLRGQYFWHKFTVQGMRQAQEYFEKSVQKDPSNALGYAWLANTYGQLGDYVGPRKDFMLKSKETSLKALQLDDKVAVAHGALGWVRWAYEWDWPGAESEFRRAIQLSPGHALSRGIYARYLDSMGRFEEAIREHRIARELDPLDLVLIYDLGDHFVVSREYDKAIAEYRSVLEMDPSFIGAHRGLAWAYEGKGMKKESISEWQEEATLAGAPNLAEAMKIAYRQGGYKSVLKARLTYDQHRRSAGSYVSFSRFAGTYAALGEKDLAVQALEKAFTEREPMAWLNVDPEWDPIRADPRFQDLVRRVGLPANPASNVLPH
jgi:TolB-like protein/DNA-binding winged helix-turn-helix (wHTH) protein/Tfp pilus assembly protein PilF